MYCFQIAELETEFEKLPPGKPQQSRFLRSQQDIEAKQEGQAQVGEEAEVEEEEEAVEIDLAEAKEVISKLPSDFEEKIVSNVKFHFK